MNRIVHIRWIDSGSSSGWCLMPVPKLELNIETIGFVLEEDEERIVVTTSVSDMGCAMDPLAIPKCCILEMYDVEIN